MKYKYKVGDRVKMNKDGEGIRYTTSSIESLEKYDYIFTIKEIYKKKEFEVYGMIETEFNKIKEIEVYRMKETNGSWYINCIKELVKRTQDPTELIYNRFEILDL